MAKFIEEVQAGMNGRNVGLPNCFDLFNDVLQRTQRGTYYAIGGMPGCHIAGTLVFMFDGTFKKVEEVQVGDLLMGPDSTSRKVLRLLRGNGDLFTVTQNKGISYTVNADHVLSLKKGLQYKEITVKDYLTKKQSSKWKGWKAPTVDFKEIPVAIDPYFLGLWLGDGTSKKPEITNVEPEILEYCRSLADRLGVVFSRSWGKYSWSFKADHRGKRKVKNISTGGVYESVNEAGTALNRAATNVSEAIRKKIRCNGFYLEYLSEGKNVIWNLLKSENLVGNKHIPKSYLLNSREIRLQLLAGLVDTDGHLSNGGYSIVQVNEKLAKEIVFLSRSLGFYTSINPKFNKKYQKIYWRVDIYGKLDQIPCKVPRKKITVAKRQVLNTTTGFKIIPAGTGDYYGFTLDKDQLYLLEDFTVTHNSGKSAFIDDNFVLVPYTELKRVMAKIPIKWFYYSFEISYLAKRAKWTASKLYADYGFDVDSNLILSKGKNRCSQEVYDKVVEVDQWMDELFDHIHFVEDVTNPTGILHDTLKYAEQNGKIQTINYSNPDGTHGQRFTGYTPNNPDEYVMVIVDHVALTKKERGYDTKENIDKLSEYFIMLRNNFKYIPIAAVQFNKGLSNIERIKLARVTSSDLAPVLEDFKDTGNIGQDCNMALGIFNPAKYNIDTYAGYEVKNMPNSFRSIHLMKNRDGLEYYVKGMHFKGGIGRFRELPSVQGFETGLYDYRDFQ